MEDENVIGALEAFQHEQDFDELADTFHRICRQF